MTRPLGTLLDALDRLADLVDRDDTSALAELRRRAEQGAFRVLVAGEAKRGKSTLINALLGRAVLPAGVVPLTALPTTIAYGDADEVEAVYVDGGAEQAGLEALGELVTEDGNPGNRRGVAAVTVRLSAPLLAKGLELVDTPGTGSVYVHNTGEATAALARMDAAVFVLSADPPISATERGFLRAVREQAVALFCVLNKIDYLSAGEQEQARAFTERVLADEVRPVTVWPPSARSALAARSRGDDAGIVDAGLVAFEAALTGYLEAHQERDLIRSIADRAPRLARGVGEQAAATIAALDLSTEELAQKAAAFRDRLAAVDQQRFESVALARSEVQRLVQQTSEQAAALPVAGGPAILASVRTRLATLDAPLAEVERAALEYASEQIRAVVDEWRVRRTAELEKAVAELDTRLTRRLDDQVSAVRTAAAALFAVELGAVPGGGHLVDSPSFFYASPSYAAQLDAIAAAVRSRLPGAFGRRRVTRYVEEQTLSLLYRQAGRTRADFQQRLQETLRALLGELEQRYTDDAGRIADAVARATQLRAHREREAAGVRGELDADRQRAATLATELDQLASNDSEAHR